MNNSIQYFLENGIPGLEKIKKVSTCAVGFFKIKEILGAQI